MNKAEIVADVADRAGVTQTDAARTIDLLLSAVTDALSRGETVQFRGFGRFLVKTSPARPGRNPRTGAPVEVPARAVVKFRPGQALADAVNR